MCPVLLPVVITLTAFSMKLLLKTLQTKGKDLEARITLYNFNKVVFNHKLDVKWLREYLGL